jgi:deoxyribodipyrimidine photo-lyase
MSTAPEIWWPGRDPRVAIVGARSRNGIGRSVVYWMQNAQRAEDNAALDLGIRLANQCGVGVTAFLALDERAPHASRRTFRFMLEGLVETQHRLTARGIPLVIRRGPAVPLLLSLTVELRPSVVVTDLSPLRYGRALRLLAAAALDVPLIEVDSEHIVPLRLIGREHWAARTIRPVLQRLLPAFLVEPPECEPRRAGQSASGLDLAGLDLDAYLAGLSVDQTVPPVADRPGGWMAARSRLDRLLGCDLAGYGAARREASSGSGLSPYLRFGQLAPLRVALAVQAARAPSADRQAFLEQLIVRRELAANFVFYHPGYRSVAGIPSWARQSLARHAADPRPALYGREALLSAATSDPVWNAAQRELVYLGWIHSSRRMYWGKRLIEWTPDPATALAIGLELNDRFALDGRSPNGFTNLLWCFGRHDRPWPERPIFGTVRSMSAAGLRRKLDLDDYVAGVERTISESAAAR